MTRRSIALGAATLIGMMLVVPSLAAAEFVREHSLAADELVVTNLVGEVAVGPAPGDRFEVRVAVMGKDADPDLVAVVVEEGARARLEVRFPVDQHRDYVYPRLGRSSSVTIRDPADDGDASWLSRLFGAMGSGVKIRSSGKGLEAWADVTVLVPREKLAEVRLGAGRIATEGVAGELALYTRSGPITAGAHRGKLRLDTGSGSVSADRIEGELLIDTGSGSVAVSDHRGPLLHVDTGSGGVTIDRAETGRLHVDTGSGGVKARAVSADRAHIDTGSGSVTLELDRMGDGPFVMDTGSGGVRFSLPPVASALINVDVGSGRITADVPGAEVLQQSRGALRLRVGDGTAPVRIDTGSGSVTITGGGAI